MALNILKKNSTSWFTIIVKHFNLTIVRIEGITFQVTLRLFSLQKTTTTTMLLCIHAASETENIIMYF